MSLPPTIAEDNIALVRRILPIDHAAQTPIFTDQMKLIAQNKHVISISSTYAAKKVISILRGRFVNGGQDPGADLRVGAESVGLGVMSIMNPIFGFLDAARVAAASGLEEGTPTMLDPGRCAYYLDGIQVSERDFTEAFELFLKNHVNSRRFAITDQELLQIMANLGIAAKHDSKRLDIVEQIDTQIKEIMKKAVINADDRAELARLIVERKEFIKHKADIESIIRPAEYNTVIPYSDSNFNGGLVQNVLGMDFVRKELNEFGLANFPPVFDYLNKNINDYMVQVINYFKRLRNNDATLQHIDYLDQLYNKQISNRTRPSNAISIVDWKPSEKSLLLLVPRTDNLYPREGGNPAAMATAAMGNVGRDLNLDRGI